MNLEFSLILNGIPKLWLCVFQLKFSFIELLPQSLLFPCQGRRWQDQHFFLKTEDLTKEFILLKLMSTTLILP